MVILISMVDSFQSWPWRYHKAVLSKHKKQSRFYNKCFISYDYIL